MVSTIVIKEAKTKMVSIFFKCALKEKKAYVATFNVFFLYLKTNGVF